ncbi:Rpn family recombination-promoting nuclease/putative transposase [Thiospirochaeta perfilievii]|uniref:Rpn family recombination-promoting nuclease/putative transposase n=1 Tax=Thiospirochaeta perfilievii TaxID=252967 RepID=A0A5C1QE09_9SPIO|nr:Rpn family recombination-promoting nuclease/putative transposase [Thiospirochaeta perfilievii]QEN05608.1 Rpn family recombination-promoting nuclease/putative transposase [Thiospirochaeta perfilievii]
MENEKKEKREIVHFDWAIKNVLREKANFVVLEGFLFAVMGEKIEILEILESESNKESEDLKLTRSDIAAKNKSGEIVLIEIQYNKELDFLKRLLFGASRSIVDNLKAGEKYENVKKVYVVSLIFFNLHFILPDNSIAKEYVVHGKTSFTGLHSKEVVFIDKKAIVDYDKLRKEENVFPEYYIISLGLFNDENVKDSLDQWVSSIKNHCVKDEFDAPGIKEMKEKLDFLSMTEEQKKSYIKYLADQASSYGVIEAAREDGREEGREEEAILKDIAYIKNMTSEGLSLETISRISGLSIQKIEDIINNKDY